MALFRSRRDRDRDRQAQQQSKELLDQYHSRASMRDGDRLLVAPGKVLENVTLAMERVDLDINTPISIEEDVASVPELLAMIDTLKMGPTLAVHVVNTAMRIMSTRYPAELVTIPLPRGYDCRKIFPVTLSDYEHEIAKSIFNQRATSAVDLAEADLPEGFSALDVPEQMAVFTGLLIMFGTKVGAMKHRTGIE